MKTLNPYLSFNGNCEAAFNFYKSVFGGEIAIVVRYKDIPPTEVATIPDSAKEKIMHLVFAISKEAVLMGSDALTEFIYTPVPTRDVTLSMEIHDEAEAKRVFNALAKGGTVTVALEKTFWAKLYGLCTDKFGIHWMISYGDGQA